MPDEVKDMKRILLATAAGLFLPSLAWAADARMTYKTASGMYAQAALGSLECGVGGNLYIVDILGSGAGKRTFMSWRKV